MLIVDTRVCVCACVCGAMSSLGSADSHHHHVAQEVSLSGAQGDCCRSGRCRQEHAHANVHVRQLRRGVRSHNSRQYVSLRRSSCNPHYRQQHSRVILPRQAPLVVHPWRAPPLGGRACLALGLRLPLSWGRCFTESYRAIARSSSGSIAIACKRCCS